MPTPLLSPDIVVVYNVYCTLLIETRFKKKIIKLHLVLLVHVEVLTLSSLHGDNMLLTVGWEGPCKTTESSTQLRQLRDRAKQGSVFLPQFNSFTLNDFVLFLLVIMSRMSLTCLLVVIVTCQHVGHTMSFKRTERKMRSCSFIV